MVAEAPRPLTRRGLTNVVAFTRLLGYVRQFHPSDEAAGADWDVIAIAGMRAVENSPDAAGLAQALDRAFRPIAPTVSIVLSGTLKEQPASPPQPDGDVKLLGWRHLGFGSRLSDQAVYRSERVTVTPPPTVLETELGGGVAARISLAVPGDASATAPPIPSTATAPMPQPTRQRFSNRDCVTRLAGVALGWNTFQHFYPYFDVVKTDWSAALRTALGEAATATNEREFADSVRRMVTGLRDGQARVTALGDSDLQFTPPVALASVDGGIVVVSAEPSSGVAPGDVIVAVDGTPAPMALEGKESLISGATPQWIRSRAAGAPLRSSRIVG